MAQQCISSVHCAPPLVAAMAGPHTNRQTSWWYMDKCRPRLVLERGNGDVFDRMRAPILLGQALKLSYLHWVHQFY